jgi:hypothetical protein
MQIDSTLRLPIHYDSYIIDRAALEPMNYYGSRRIPFLFVIDYLGQQPFVCPLHDIPDTILFWFEGYTNAPHIHTVPPKIYFEK